MINKIQTKKRRDGIDQKINTRKKQKNTKTFLVGTLGVAQLVERLLPKSVICSSNPVVDKFCLLSTVLKNKCENKRGRQRPNFTKNTFLSLNGCYNFCSLPWTRKNGQTWRQNFYPKSSTTVVSSMELLLPLLLLLLYSLMLLKMLSLLLLLLLKVSSKHFTTIVLHDRDFFENSF